MAGEVRPEAVDVLARLLRGPFAERDLAPYIAAQRRASALEPFSEAEQEAAGGIAISMQQLDGEESVRRAAALSHLARVAPAARTIDEAIGQLSDDELAEFNRLLSGDPPR